MHELHVPGVLSLVCLVCGRGVRLCSDEIVIADRSYCMAEKVSLISNGIEACEMKDALNSQPCGCKKCFGVGLFNENRVDRQQK